MSRPLAGRKILITRARHQSGRMAEALEEVGAEVLRLPTIEIIPPETYAPLDGALQQILEFDWLIVSSANGVVALGERMQVLGIAPARLGHLEIAAIGQATAGALGRIGLKVSAIPEEYVAEAVVALLKDRVAGKRMLLARAAVARDVIPDELRKYGAEVVVAEAYCTVIPNNSVEQLRALFAPGLSLPDAVTFTSASTVNNFFALLSAAGMEWPAGLKAVSIGPVTSQALRRQGWEPAREADRYDIPGVAAACVALLTGQ